LNPIHCQSVQPLLQSLLTDIQDILGGKLAGFYLYGSLVWGDFDEEISDIDLLALLTSDINEEDLALLQSMHADFARRHKEWDDRIEVQYYSTEAIRTFRIKPGPMGVISPGEPLHIVEAGTEWLTNWYFVQDYGIALFGPSPGTFLEPISKDEFLHAVKAHALEWGEYVKGTLHSRPYQGYAILTMCRALYTLQTGEQVSKMKAAQWAKTEIPEYAQLIDQALEWRKNYREKDIVHEDTYSAAFEFVQFVISRITAGEA